MRLHDKVAIITGAGRGIGRATALRFAEEGARVVCADLDLAFVTEVADEINARARAGANGRAVHAAEGTSAEGNGVKPVLTPTAYALPVRVNVADAASCRAMVAAALNVERRQVESAGPGLTKQKVAHGVGDVGVDGARTLPR